MVEQNVVHLYYELLHKKKKEWTTNTYNNFDEHFKYCVGYATFFWGE